MKKKNSDYEAFLQADQPAPRGLSDAIFARVKEDLNPNPFVVFSKLMGIHALTAVVTLSVCPQFGIKLGNDDPGLMRVFMALGEYGCLVACGFFFTGMSLLIASLALRGEEVRKIRQNRLLGLGVLTLLSLGFFIMVDAELIFGLALAWFIGAIVGSIATLELGWRLRFRSG